MQFTVDGSRISAWLTPRRVGNNGQYCTDLAETVVKVGVSGDSDFRFSWSPKEKLPSVNFIAPQLKPREIERQIDRAQKILSEEVERVFLLRELHSAFHKNDNIIT